MSPSLRRGVRAAIDRAGSAVASALPVLALVTGLVAGAPATAQDAPAAPAFKLKETDPPIGSNIRRDIAHTAGPVPLNLRYDQLSAAQRTALHGWWEHIADADEPPFPRDGLRPLVTAMHQVQARLLVTGDLLLVATVEPDGQVSRVEAVDSPSPSMARAAAQILMLTPFKPARCAGAPCRMDFPLRQSFVVR